MKTVLRNITLVISALVVSMALADIKVLDVEVFSGYPWKEVVVGYTITGNDEDADEVRLTATDKSANKSYTAKTLTGAGLSEGRHVMRWNAAADGVKLSSANVVFTVSVEIGVQLWADGPYWAKCNVGATKPEEYGYYFWWSDTVGYVRNADKNGWVSAKNGTPFSFSSGNCPINAKLTSWLQSAGYFDATGNLVSKYDAVTAHLGAPWRMPTDVEFSALKRNCTTMWTTRNGVYGRLVTGKGAYASKSIFFPAAGYGDGSSLHDPGSYGYYWSSTPGPVNSDFAHGLYFSSGNFGWFSSSNFGEYRDYRSIGFPVRPLRGFAQ